MLPVTPCAPSPSFLRPRHRLPSRSSTTRLDCLCLPSKSYYYSSKCQSRRNVRIRYHCLYAPVDLTPFSSELLHKYVRPFASRLQTFEPSCFLCFIASWRPRELVPVWCSSCPDLQTLLFETDRRCSSPRTAKDVYSYNFPEDRRQLKLATVFDVPMIGTLVSFGAFSCTAYWC